MRTLIATILAVFASSAFATGVHSHDWSSAGAAAGGVGLTKSFAVSKSTGNGYSVNNGYASSGGVVTGYARDNVRGTYNTPGTDRRVGYDNGYVAGVTIDTYAHTEGYSENHGLARGGTFNLAGAGGIGAAGGKAGAKTHRWQYVPNGCFFCGGHYEEKVYSRAGSKAGGIVGAGALSVTKTTGNMWGGTKAGGSVGLKVWGVADTTQHSFIAGGKTRITPSTYSVSYGNVPPVWNTGYAKTGGIAGAGGIAGEKFGGYVYDD